MNELDIASKAAEFRHKVREEVHLGRLASALALCDEAARQAEDLGHSELRDLAICNRGSILVNQSKGDEVVRDLRKILLRSSSADNSFLAAYAVSQYHELRGEKDRSLFYARLALSHGENSDLPEFTAFGYNRIANLLMLDSYFEEACGHYEKALELLPGDQDLDRALLFSNKGYCQTVLGDFNRGLKCLFKSLDLIRQKGAEAWERFPRLGLSFAYIELGRWDQARFHGRRALQQSEATQSVEQIKNSLYLLGEAEKLAGNDSAAYEHFERLQAEFYVDKPYIIDFLMATDIRKLINLMA